MKVKLNIVLVLFAIILLFSQVKCLSLRSSQTHLEALHSNSNVQEHLNTHDPNANIDKPTIPTKPTIRIRDTQAPSVQIPVKPDSNNNKNKPKETTPQKPSDDNRKVPSKQNKQPVPVPSKDKSSTQKTSNFADNIPLAYQMAFKELKVKQPKLYEKLQKGKLTAQDQESLDEFLVSDNNFVSSIVGTITQGVSDDDNCLKTLSLSKDQNSSLASYIVSLIDWNDLKNDKLQPITADQKNTLTKKVNQDEDLGSRIGKCVSKILKKSKK